MRPELVFFVRKFLWFSYSVLSGLKLIILTVASLVERHFFDFEEFCSFAQSLDQLLAYFPDYIWVRHSTRYCRHLFEGLIVFKFGSSTRTHFLTWDLGLPRRYL